LLKSGEESAADAQKLIDAENLTLPAQFRPYRPRKKAAFSPNKSERIFWEFIDYLNAELERYKDVEFHCKYSLDAKNWVSWVNPSLVSGESLESNHEMQELCSAVLRRALEEGNEELCFEVVRVAMDWGGVYYCRGVRKGNQKVVERLYKEHDLLNTLRRNYDHIRNRDLELLDFFSSGWSIVWYLLDRENLMILSSRKVYALNKALMAFRSERGYEAVPASLDFGQLVYQGSQRYIEGVRYVYTKQGKLVLLKKCVRVLSALKERGDFSTNKQLDDLLFLMGE
ncbi:MAG: hypothetical protein ABFC73_06055, partial [Clostridiaceae bacterium]